MLKKRRRKRKREKTNKIKQSHKNYKENIGTKLITNTKKQKLKIQSRVWNFKNTMLKKRRRKIKREKTNKNKPSCKNYKENIGTKLITNTKKHKLKIQSRVWNFRYTMLHKRRRERKRVEKKSHRNYKKIYIGTKLITNTKKLKLKIQSGVWNFKNTMLKKRRRKREKKTKSQKL